MISVVAVEGLGGHKGDQEDVCLIAVRYADRCRIVALVWIMNDVQVDPPFSSMRGFLQGEVDWQALLDESGKWEEDKPGALRDVLVLFETLHTIL